MRFFAHSSYITGNNHLPLCDKAFFIFFEYVETTMPKLMGANFTKFKGTVSKVKYFTKILKSNKE